MQIFFFSILAVIFCFINYKIIKSDQKIKKIPNKNLLELLFLLPFWYIFLYFFPISEIHILGFLLQIWVSFFISFLLFNFGIWRAWDAKYLLVLSLFIPYIGIIPLIGNLGLFTLLYLFLYFLWFFIGRSIFYKWYAKNLIWNIKTDLQEKWKIYKNNKWWKSFAIIFQWTLIFLIVFVSFRLARMYIFTDMVHRFSHENNLWNILEKYHFYLIFLWMWFSFLLFYIARTIGKKLGSKIPANMRKSPYLIFSFWSIITILLLVFIWYEWHIDAEKTKHYLIRIFTIWLSLYIFAKIIWYGYKLSFGVAEEQFIDIKNLEEGIVVDKKYLHNMYFEQSSLWAKLKEKIEKNKNYKEDNPDFIFINPEKYFLEIKNPIDTETKNMLQNIYTTVNNHHTKIGTKNFQKHSQIKILKTFSFWIYIFLWFLITFIFWNAIIQFLIKKIIEWITF